MVQGLDLEVLQFNIRTLYVAPGGFRTNFIDAPLAAATGLSASSSGDTKQGVDSTPTTTTTTAQPASSNLLDEYAPLREAAPGFLSTVGDTMPGDPTKGARIMVDVVKSEGCARGREMPKRLFLGSDAYKETHARLEGFLRELELSRELTQGICG